MRVLRAYSAPALSTNHCKLLQSLLYTARSLHIRECRCYAMHVYAAVLRSSDTHSDGLFSLNAQLNAQPATVDKQRSHVAFDSKIPVQNVLVQNLWSSTSVFAPCSTSDLSCKSNSEIFQN